MNPSNTLNASSAGLAGRPLSLSTAARLFMLILLLAPQRTFGYDEPKPRLLDDEFDVPEVEYPRSQYDPQPEVPPSPADDYAQRSRRFDATIPTTKMTVRLAPRGDQPDLIKLRDEKLKPQDPYVGRLSSMPDVYPWMSAPPYGSYIFLHHDPLLFEDIPAERYGQVYHPCVQPVVSFTKFVGTVPMLPYKISMNYCAARNEDAYYARDFQGNLRPGVVEGAYFPDLSWHAPYPKSRIKSMLVEIGVIGGIVVFLP